MILTHGIGKPFSSDEIFFSYTKLLNKIRMSDNLHEAQKLRYCGQPGPVTNDLFTMAHAQILKEKLQLEIVKLVLEFEKQSNTKVTSVSIERTDLFGDMGSTLTKLKITAELL